MSKLGIIQSRGLGDIIIALPLAHYYHTNYDSEIYWPICEQFWPAVKNHAPWVKWIPIPQDAQGDFFYTEPLKRLKNFGVEEILCLYQSLNIVPQLSQVPWFQIQHFDEFKYTRAGVPFLEKWNLAQCITRNLEREQEVYDKVVTRPEYYVTHFKGSNFTHIPDLSGLPPEWQQIDVDSYPNISPFDWISVIEKAQAVICIDSVYANMIDQLRINDVDKYWIPRSHIHLTPVLGTEWTILEPLPTSLAAQKIFGAAPN